MEGGTGRALVLHPAMPGHPEPIRSAEARLAEAVGLAHAIRLEVVHQEVVRLIRARPATLLGRGVVDRLRDVVRTQEVAVAVIDSELSPVQQRNLERGLSCKVIDRTALILEIFGARARTREGQLQVELAALSYQRSRLVRSWTHLERQRGGYGFLGGPGESQLEIDRRLITDRIARLRCELDSVRRTRALHRKARHRVAYPVVALVGYTNAGKSTLFNRLTQAHVFAGDALFATLDPTMRRMRVASGQGAILSDTVGFISDLPTDLIVAFRATLEEVTEAALIVHVRDIAHPDSDAQKQDVHKVLSGLGLEDRLNGEVIEVLNKIDLLDDNRRAMVRQQALRNGGVVTVSAITGDGCDELLALIGQRLTAAKREVTLSLPLDDGAALAWLYDHGHVVSRCDDERRIHLRVRLDPADLARFERRHGAAVQPDGL